MRNDDVLDITGYKETGGALAAKVAKEVESTQLGLQRPLPNILQMTDKQFKSLTNTLNQTSYITSTRELPSMEFKGKVEKAYLFYTPHNVMDVQVVDKPDRQLLV